MDLDKLKKMKEEAEREYAERMKTRSYDVTSQDRIIRGRLPQLDVIYEKVMRDSRKDLARVFEAEVDMNLNSTEFFKFGQFINTFPMPSTMYVVGTNLLGAILVVIDPRLVARAVGLRTGFEIVEEFQDRTPLTISIVDELIKPLTDSFAAAFSQAIGQKVEITSQRFETNPQFVGIVPPTEVVVASEFELVLGSETGEVSFMLPYSGIEEFKQELSTACVAAEKRSFKTVGEKAFDLMVSLDVVFGRRMLEAPEIEALKEGDYLELRRDFSAYSFGEKVLDLEFDDNKLKVRSKNGKA